MTIAYEITDINDSRMIRLNYEWIGIRAASEKLNILQTCEIVKLSHLHLCSLLFNNVLSVLRTLTNSKRLTRKRN